MSLAPAHQRLQQRLDRGEWKAANRRLIARALGPKRRVLEIGAGIGVCTVAICEAIHPGHVIAYEPSRTMNLQAKRRLDESGVSGYNLVRAGIGVQAGSGRLVSPSGEPWRGEIVADEKGSIHIDALDAVCWTNKIDALVLDAEGVEHTLLRRCVLDVQDIICEVHGDDNMVADLMSTMVGRGWTAEIRTSRDPWDNVCVWWRG